MEVRTGGNWNQAVIQLMQGFGRIDHGLLIRKEILGPDSMQTLGLKLYRLLKIHKKVHRPPSMSCDSGFPFSGF